MEVEIPELITIEWIETLSEEELVAVLMFAKDIYYNGEEEPVMDDDQFDLIEQYLRGINNNNPYFLKTGAEVRGSKVPLPVALGSLDQVYTGDAEKWIRAEGLLDEDLVITDKEDGLSILIAYDHTGALKIAFTRGDGTNGHDITRHVRKMKNVPQQIPMTPILLERLKRDNVMRGGLFMMRGEIILSDEDFARLNAAGQLGRVYKNPRNYSAGQINKKVAEPIFLDHVHVIVYEVIGD